MKKEAMLAWLDQHSTDFTQISDAIWEKPELSYHEFFASKLQSDFMEGHGFDVKRDVAGMNTAFIAEWGIGRPIFGFAGEFDALPGLSQKSQCNFEPVVEGGPGHGCGHNLLGVGCMAAAVAVKEWLQSTGTQGTVRYYGCPAEEDGAGKTFMARACLFDDLDLAFNYHPNSLTYASKGSCLGVNHLRFIFHGKTAHAGGSPWEGRFAMRTRTALTNELHWIFSDHLQSSSVILDEEGDLYSKTLYTAFGEERDIDTTGLSDSPTDYKYTGQRSYVDDFGLHFYVARWYDPYLNQFIQPDTIVQQPGNSGDWNRYAYVLYNPANFNDPSGHYRIYYPEWDPSYGQRQKLNTCGVVSAAVALSMLRGEFVDYTDLLYEGYSQATWEIHETVTVVPCVWTGADVYCSSPITENIDYYGLGVSGTLQGANLNAMSDVKATVTQGTRQDLIDNVYNGLLTMVV